MNHLRWNLLPLVPAGHPATDCGFSPLLAQLMYNRGLTNPAQIEAFIKADSSLSGDPLLLPDIHQAINRVYQGLLSGEKIAVYGDFDVDGITGTAILVQGLQALGGDITPYIPHRIREGHGLNSAALDYLKGEGISLVITVDCGVTGIAQVKKAKRHGLDIVITDHHTPLGELPEAVAVVDPKRDDSKYPFDELAGVGVAYKFLEALYKGIGWEKQIANYLDLVALGTVADMMPLLGENRYLVKQGLKELSKNRRPGIREISILAGIDIANIGTEEISWALAPRLNAASRLEHALTSYKLMVTESTEEAQDLSILLEEQNSERQKMTSRSLAKAREQVQAKGIAPLLIASDPDYPPGIIGLVAGRLSEEFYRPSIVIKVGEKSSNGSCRSIPEFNIIKALNECHELMSDFGGHDRAAGFTMPTKNLARLEEKLGQIAEEQLEGLDLRPKLDIDAVTTLSQMGGETYQSLQSLAPFGMGNPVPTFLSRSVEVVTCQTMGNNGDHLRLRLKQNNVNWEAVAFGLGERSKGMHSHIDIVYNLRLERWRGEERLRLNIQDLAPSKQR
ncbi:MAG: single-stranded-DNA-specific exonuclease RecJ [Dehalococcoidales bacterium]|nr:single-stranded-DNA-specific exonuclease RecJ [Dehalococcoidales bacterium]